MKSSHPHSKISPQHPSVRKHIASIPFIPPPSLRNYSDWIQFPQDAIPTVFLIINCLLMPFKWTFWTNRAILKAESSDIRGRLCNQYAVLGSTAGMLVTVSAAAFYSPPHSINPSDEYLVPVYGSLMFSASIMFVSYIVLSLTVLFPLIESAQDEVLSYIFHDLLKLMQSIEGLVFTMGINLFALGLLVSIPIIYSWQMFYIFCGVTAAVYSFTVGCTILSFMAIDPITALHMGITCSPGTIQRAQDFSDIYQHLQNNENENEHEESSDLGKQENHDINNNNNNNENDDDSVDSKESTNNKSEQIHSIADKETTISTTPKISEKPDQISNSSLDALKGPTEAVTQRSPSMVSYGRRNTKFEFKLPSRRISHFDGDDSGSYVSNRKSTITSYHSVALKSHAAMRRNAMLKGFGNRKITRRTIMDDSPIKRSTKVVAVCPSFTRIFLNDDRLTCSFISTMEESTKVMDAILSAGFDATKDLVEFLNFISNDADNGNYHQVQCLVAMGIKPFHAYKLLLMFQEFE